MPASAARAHIRFIGALFALLLLLTLSGYAIACSAWYVGHVGFQDQVMDARYARRASAADILFVGDSSLEFGVIPSLVQQRVGMSGYNLGISAPAFEFVGEALLDHYLQQNPRPRVIVLYISPWTNPDHPNGEQFYDVMSILARHDPVSRFAWDFGAAHPQALFQFPYAVWRLMAFDTQWNPHAHELRQQIMDRDGGYVPYWLPDEQPARATVLTLTDGCSLPLRQVRPPRDFIARFRARYETAGTRVIVYVAPLADCDTSFADVAGAYAGIADNAVYRLPHGLFIKDVALTHLIPEGAVQNSALVGDFIAGRVDRAAPALQAGGAARDPTSQTTP